jgi:hypothetical protein
MRGIIASDRCDAIRAMLVLTACDERKVVRPAVGTVIEVAQGRLSDGCSEPDARVECDAICVCGRRQEPLAVDLAVAVHDHAAPMGSRKQQRNEFPPGFEVGLLESAAQSSSLLRDALYSVAFGGCLAGSGLREFDVPFHEPTIRRNRVEFAIGNSGADGRTSLAAENVRSIPRASPAFVRAGGAEPASRRRPELAREHASAGQVAQAVPAALPIRGAPIPGAGDVGLERDGMLLTAKDEEHHQCERREAAPAGAGTSPPVSAAARRCWPPCRCRRGGRVGTGRVVAVALRRAGRRCDVARCLRPGRRVRRGGLSSGAN